ncbi:MAG: hypothetical protein ACRD4I_15065 [Candidatus Angelobacter sp.]
MRLLNFAAVLLFAASSLFVVSARAQRSQSGAAQTPGASQQTPESTNHLAARDLPDSGIYLNRGAGSTTCGSIVSYNFSPGDHPQLESITTCTPSNAVATKRARGTKEVQQSHHVVLMDISLEKGK